MKKLLNLGIAAMMVTSLLAIPALADQTMDQIEKTGKIKLGFREGSIPFAFVDPKVGKHVGFSVDMANELAKYLGLRFGKTIEVDPLPLHPKPASPWWLTAPSMLRWVRQPILKNARSKPTSA